MNNIWCDLFLENKIYLLEAKYDLHLSFQQINDSLINEIIASNAKNNGFHGYHMFKYKNRLITFKEYFNLCTNTYSKSIINDLKSVHHIGYHTNIGSNTYFSFATSHPSFPAEIINNGGVLNDTSVIHNVKVSNRIKYMNPFIVVDSQLFNEYFIVANGQKLLPYSLRLLDKNELIGVVLDGVEKLINHNKVYHLIAGQFEEHITLDTLNDIITDNQDLSLIGERLKNKNYQSELLNKFINDQVSSNKWKKLYINKKLINYYELTK